MKIFVNDVAVKRNSGGVYTVLQSVYSSAVKMNDDHFTFLLGDDLFPSKPNIKIETRSDLQNNYVKRVAFDWFFGKKLITNAKPDVYISLQNTAQMGLGKINQFTYVHQPLPFQRSKKFSFFKKSERKLAFYQYIVGFLIKTSIKFSNTKVIVQSEWLKNELVSRGITKSENVLVSFPVVDNNMIVRHVSQNEDKVNFFFPSTAMLYKNHTVVVEALQYIPESVKSRINIIFTITLQEFQTLTNKRDVPSEISLLGRIEKTKVAEILSESTLLFPSYIETFGLPILEAKQLERPMLVADVPVLKESVSGYSDVQYFEPFNAQELADLIAEFVNTKSQTKSVVLQPGQEIDTNFDNLITMVKGKLNGQSED